jgi:hypothetical protein
VEKNEELEKDYLRKKAKIIGWEGVRLFGGEGY